MSWRAAWAVAAALLAGCGDHAATGPDLAQILADKPAPTLSAYGFFEDAGGREPAEGVVSYDLVNPLFSDHATKHRFVFTPPGEAAAYRDPEVFDFPVGSALIKTFAYAPDMRTPAVGEFFVETRVLIRKADGWAAYPYIWNEEQTEAVYAPIGGRRTVETIAPDGAAVHIDYAVPNRNQCKTCHQVGDALTPIGPAARRLNHRGPYGVGQISDWVERGLLTGAPAHPPVEAAAFDPGQPLAARARAYLDINCAHCHRAGGSASNSGLWLTADETEPVRLGVGKHPTAAGRGSGALRLVVSPGAPEASILAYRMASLEPGVAMPELGRALSDEPGVALVQDWIAAMDGAAGPPD